MSNLGWYQKITTAAKAVGGPKILLGLIAGGGAVGTILTQKAIQAIKTKIKSKNINYIENEKVFVILSDGKDSNGLEFKAGDRYKILNCDADAILIEILGNKDNPYFTSSDFLRKVSKFY